LLNSSRGDFSTANLTPEQERSEEMTTVRQMLEEKGFDVWTVGSDDAIEKALELMAEKDVGALPVIDQGQLVGIISERDLARSLVSKHGCSMDTPVNEMMTHTVYFIHPEQTTDECMLLMTNRHIRHLPVLDHNKLVGLISIGDVVRNIISYQSSTIKGLENFITGQMMGRYSG
jgi:CBS domain-containing protein